MHAIICHAFGDIGRLSWEAVQEPAPKAGEILIDIRAAGVNFPDGLMVRGDYQVKPRTPFTPGSEVAGIVCGVGEGVTRFAEGDRVVALCTLGGFAERVAVSADTVLAIPDDMSFEVASGFMLVYGTSLHALADKGNLAAGQTLLVLGAAGGVGLAAVDIGAALGARVIAAASSEEKLALACAHGAAMGINYGACDLKTALKRLVPGGVDVVYDPVGGASTEAAVRGLAWGGRLLVVGFAAGDIPRLPLNLLLLREASAIGVFWGAFTQQDPAGHARNVARLMQWFAEGRVKPHVGATYPMREAATALAAVMGRRAQGKVVLLSHRN